MNVTLGSDNAFGNLHFAARTDDLAGTAAGNVAGFANRSLHAECARVGEGNLNLRGTSGRA